MSSSALLPEARIETQGYRPRGAAWKLLHLQSPEILISGPAGTGKSVACLYKLHLCADKKPGFRALILRKTRASLTESGLVSFERFVVPRTHPCLCGPQRAFRRCYKYPNGSEIIVGGLDRDTKVLSTDYDLIFVQEAIEFSEDTWETLTTRLRTGTLSYQQLIADTNPDRPAHWLKRRCDAARTLLLESRHEDNPLYWDAEQKAWTERGRVYIGRLNALTGPRLQRLRFGRWVQAEGVVYELWDASVHVVDSWDEGTAKEFVAGVDWGFTGPGVILVGALDGDNRITIVREIYQTKRTIDWWIETAKGLRDRYRISRFLCDPSEPAYIEQLKRAGLPAEKGVNDVMPGIGAVTARLKMAADRRPRLRYLRGACKEKDGELDDLKHPCSLVEEMDAYLWKPNAKKEEPIKENDHAMDALRYLVAALDLTPKRRLSIFL